MEYLVCQEMWNVKIFENIKHLYQEMDEMWRKFLEMWNICVLRNGWNMKIILKNVKYEITELDEIWRQF